MIIISILAVTFIYFSSPRPAHAYLDPGSVSYVLQIVIAAIIGGLVAIKIFWTSIKLFLSRIFKRDKPARDPETKQD